MKARDRAKRLQRLLALENALSRVDASRLAALTAEEDDLAAERDRAMEALGTGMGAPLAALLSSRVAHLQSAGQALLAQRAVLQRALSARALRLNQIHVAADRARRQAIRAEGTVSLDRTLDIATSRSRGP